MSRHNFASTMRALARAAAQAERARHQAEARQRAAIARQEREAAARAKADAKESSRLYLVARMQEVDELNNEMRRQENDITDLLVRALKKTPAVPSRPAIKPFTPLAFNEAPWQSAAPSRESVEFQAAPLGFFSRYLPGAGNRLREREAAAQARFQVADSAYQKTRRDRAAALADFDSAENERKLNFERENAQIVEFYRKLQEADYETVITHFKTAVEKSLSGDPDALAVEIGYSTQSRHLVADLELPEISVVPGESSHRYIKANDRIDAIQRPVTKRKALCANLLCQIVLKCIDTIYRASPPSVVDCLTLNGMLDTIDPGTGRPVRVCLLSVRVTADTFRTLNLAQVNPEQCLRSLNASVSRAPSELVPVKPIIELNMADPRFIDTSDVMSGLEGVMHLLRV